MAHVSAAERRPQLVQAAIALMAREGVAAGSTRAIAAELGVAQATVHYTFGTKKDLYRAVVGQLTADFVAQVRAAAPDGGPFADQVRTLARALWRSVTAEPGRCMLITEFITLSLRDPDLLDIMRAHQRDVERTAADILRTVAADCGEELATPAADIAVYFLAGVDGLIERHLLLAAPPVGVDPSAGEAGDDEARSAAARATDRALAVLVSTTLDLCRRAPVRPV